MKTHNRRKNIKKTKKKRGGEPITTSDEQPYNAALLTYNLGNNKIPEDAILETQLKEMVQNNEAKIIPTDSNGRFIDAKGQIIKRTFLTKPPLKKNAKVYIVDSLYQFGIPYHFLQETNYAEYERGLYGKNPSYYLYNDTKAYPLVYMTNWELHNFNNLTIYLIL